MPPSRTGRQRPAEEISESRASLFRGGRFRVATIGDAISNLEIEERSVYALN
jgi:hypothetical protein